LKRVKVSNEPVVTGVRHSRFIFFFYFCQTKNVCMCDFFIYLLILWSLTISSPSHCLSVGHWGWASALGSASTRARSWEGPSRFRPPSTIQRRLREAQALKTKTALN
jgi:hypothetical protein